MLNQVYQLSLLLIWLRTKKVNKHKICHFLEKRILTWEVGILLPINPIKKIFEDVFIESPSSCHSSEGVSNDTEDSSFFTCLVPGNVFWSYAFAKWWPEQSQSVSWKDQSNCWPDWKAYSSWSFRLERVAKGKKERLKIFFLISTWHFRKGLIYQMHLWWWAQ